MRFFNLFTPAHTEIVRKSQADAALCGRSMVEMLGVLAIIGVLSVGAISGYSKAMFKYKLNRQAENLNMLFGNIIQIMPELSRAFNETSFDTDVLRQLNLIPDGITIMKGSLRDNFNNNMWFRYYRHPRIGHKEALIGISLERSNDKISQQASEICRNIVTTAKHYSSGILYLSVRQTDSDTPDDYTSFMLLGDTNCTSKSRCLRNAGREDLDYVCSSCVSELACTMYIRFVL